jgi:hypothetical protein
MCDSTPTSRPAHRAAASLAVLALLAVAATPLAARASDDAAPTLTPLVLAYSQLPTPAPVQWAAVRYVPEPQARPKSPTVKAPREATRARTEIHGGVYDPESNIARRGVAGIRGGPMLTRNLQLGLAADWMYDSQNLTVGSSGQVGPGGTPIDVQQVLERASLHQVPLMAFAQFEGWGLLYLVPYVGAAGGYQFMFLTADNYATDEHLSATLGGWAWQTWAGIGLPLGNRVRASGEVFLHGGEVSRVTTDAVSGTAYRETARTDGLGARFGLSWGM